jgi:hypothetical protein
MHQTSHSVTFWSDYPKGIWIIKVAWLTWILWNYLTLRSISSRPEIIQCYDRYHQGQKLYNITIDRLCNVMSISSRPEIIQRYNRYNQGRKLCLWNNNQDSIAKTVYNQTNLFTKTMYNLTNWVTTYSCCCCKTVYNTYRDTYSSCRFVNVLNIPPGNIPIWLPPRPLNNKDNLIIL